MNIKLSKGYIDMFLFTLEIQYKLIDNAEYFKSKFKLWSVGNGLSIGSKACETKIVKRNIHVLTLIENSDSL